MGTRFNYLQVPDQYNHYFTKYPQGYTILEALLEWVAQVDLMTDNLNEMNVLIDDFIKMFDEDLQQTVIDKLEEWKLDGTLDDVINGALFNQKADKGAVDTHGYNVLYPPNDLIAGVNDGTTPTATAIQNVLDLALTEGQVKVVIPDGTYLLDKPLAIYKNTHLLMGKNAVLLRGHTAGILSNGKDKENIYSGYNGNGNILIEGGVFDGNIDNFPSGFVHINLGHGENITIRDSIFKEVTNAHALDIAGCKDVLIENCHFRGFLDTTGVDTYNYSEAVQIGEITSDGFPPFGTYDGTPSVNIEVKGCYFGGSDHPFTRAWGVGVGHHAATNNIFNSNIKVTGNTFDGMTYAAVRVFKYKDVKVTNNSFIDCKRGVEVAVAAAGSYSSQNLDGTQSNMAQAAKNVFINNNSFLNTSEYIVTINGSAGALNIAKAENILIENNIIDGQLLDNPPIYIQWADGVKVLGNIFRNVHRGVQTNFACNLDILYNTFSNLEAVLFYSDESDSAKRGQGHSRNINISNNIIEELDIDGIQIRYADGFTIANNIIKNAGKKTHNTYIGIYAWTSLNGVIEGNKVYLGDSANKLKYGISVDGTCTNVRVSNNDADGATGDVLVSGTTNFSGFYISYGVFPGQKYKITVSSTGVLTTAAVN